MRTLKPFFAIWVAIPALCPCATLGQANLIDVPSKEMQAGGDANKRFFLIGPRSGAKPPPAGFKLLIVLPGGDGSAEFNPFVRRILENALDDSYLLAELIAPAWSQDPNRIVWPTRTNPVANMKFSTEEYIEAAIAEVKKAQKIDPKYIFALGWSSGGPPCYAASLSPGKQITGTFVAMSVFQPWTLPPLTNAKDGAYFILHSPGDFIPIRMAESARDQLKANGAKTELHTYEGGHGWHGDVFGNIRSGIKWLEVHAHN